MLRSWALAFRHGLNFMLALTILTGSFSAVTGSCLCRRCLYLLSTVVLILARATVPFFVQLLGLSLARARFCLCSAQRTVSHEACFVSSLLFVLAVPLLSLLSGLPDVS